ncbi:hypothetical protein M427DRAFT_53770 [Gonapodya prolifera JEL478]|uniref:C962R-like N-terminal AEP domain-containing protein n=1 Tax=Gonapodya prolifera (strain JEL478) TaxID=1344416 RepID=A0A139ANS6_GONPJ|nr:hypothetical protein M427DRAFT_53770 [Gonapodya prolifera JEL478]|eukprot:KXS18378.1 hypothetical protein M427DRAFT_53770 [Gonapodya prolifera JEL478]
MDGGTELAGQFAVPASEFPAFWQLYSAHVREKQRAFLTENVFRSPNHSVPIVRPFFDVDFPSLEEFTGLLDSTGLNSDAVAGVFLSCTRSALSEVLAEVPERNFECLVTRRRYPNHHKLHLHFPHIITSSGNNKIAAISARLFLQSSFSRLASDHGKVLRTVDWGKVVDDQVYASSLRLFGSLKPKDEDGASEYVLLEPIDPTNWAMGVRERRTGELSVDKLCSLSVRPDLTNAEQRRMVDEIEGEEFFMCTSGCKVARTLVLGTSDNGPPFIRVDNVSEQVARSILDYVGTLDGVPGTKKFQPSSIVGVPRDHFGKNVAVVMRPSQCPFDLHEGLVSPVFLLTNNGAFWRCRTCDYASSPSSTLCTTGYSPPGMDVVSVPKVVREMLDKREREGYLEQAAKWRKYNNSSVEVKR